MVSILPLISSSHIVYCRILRTVLGAPTSIGITATSMFNSFFSSQARSMYLFIFLLPFIFSVWSAVTSNSSKWQVLIFLLIINRSDLLTEIWWPVFITKFQRIPLCAYIICQHGQILISCTDTCWSPFLTSRVTLNINTDVFLSSFGYCNLLILVLFILFLVALISFFFTLFLCSPRVIVSMYQRDLQCCTPYKPVSCISL